MIKMITESESFKYKIKITGKIPAAGNTKDVKIAVPWKYLSNFWRKSEIPLINCEINLILTWSEDCVILSATGHTKFRITGAIQYVPVVILSAHDNAIPKQVSRKGVGQYLDFLIDQVFKE